jgi:hypothetical protein
LPEQDARALASLPQLRNRLAWSNPHRKSG